MKIAYCIEAASYAYAVPMREMLSGRRFRDVAWARFAAMWLARTQGYSNARIARVLRMSDHTSVIHGSRRAAELHDADEDFGDRLQKAWDHLTARHGGAQD